jgi:hypothetical protein
MSANRGTSSNKNEPKAGVLLFWRVVSRSPSASKNGASAAVVAQGIERIVFCRT